MRRFTDEPGVEEAFRDFRQSAVRLVERVNDALDPIGDASTEQRNNLQHVRSIFGKWAADILLALHVTPGVGFEELRRSLPGISPRVLSLKLKDLEEHEMIRREIFDSRPPRAKYTLTERGWTVAWLAQPVFLYLRLTRPRSSEAADPPLDPLMRSPKEPLALPETQMTSVPESAGANLRAPVGKDRFRR